jgi:hypothetical protein
VREPTGRKMKRRPPVWPAAVRNHVLHRYLTSIPGSECTISMSTDDEQKKQGFGKTIGLGVITGAADDDPSAIGTYASAPLPLHLTAAPGSAAATSPADRRRP